jgi:hypothetical protein
VGILRVKKECNDCRGPDPLFTLFVVPAVYLLMATDHSHTGEVARNFAKVL